MFITKSAHEEIVATLKEQIRQLTEERDVYRKWFLERAAGVKYPDPVQPVQVVTAPAPVAAPEMTMTEKIKSFRLDRGEWSLDDKELYETYWAAPLRARGVPEDELDWHYHEKYGNSLPLATLIQ